MFFSKYLQLHFSVVLVIDVCRTGNWFYMFSLQRVIFVTDFWTWMLYINLSNTALGFICFILSEIFVLSLWMYISTSGWPTSNVIQGIGFPDDLWSPIVWHGFLVVDKFQIQDNWIRLNPRKWILVVVFAQVDSNCIAFWQTPKQPWNRQQSKLKQGTTSASQLLCSVFLQTWIFEFGLWGQSR